jgi:uncharacterized protein YrzB (UPF0473 family)
MEDERIIELEDDEGGKERFLFLTTVEHEGRQFAVLTPEEVENEEEEAIVILEMLDSGDGDEMELVSVDDDNLAEIVFNKYMESVEDEECDEEGCDCEHCHGHEEEKK